MQQSMPTPEGVIANARRQYFQHKLKHSFQGEIWPVSKMKRAWKLSWVRSVSKSVNILMDRITNVARLALWKNFPKFSGCIKCKYTFQYISHPSLLCSRLAAMGYSVCVKQARFWILINVGHNITADSDIVSGVIPGWFVLCDPDDPANQWYLPPPVWHRPHPQRRQTPIVDV